RISAARGSETARSRKPRSMSSSDGGLRSRRVVRLSRLSRAALRASSRVHRCGLPLESSAPDLAGRSASFSSAVSNRLLVAHHSLTGSAEAGERCLYGRHDAYSTPERSTHVCSERVWTSGRGPVFVRSEVGYGAPRRRSLSDGLRLSGLCKPEV